MCNMINSIFDIFNIIRNFYLSNIFNYNFIDITWRNMTSQFFINFIILVIFYVFIAFLLVFSIILRLLYKISLIANLSYLFRNHLRFYLDISQIFFLSLHLIRHKILQISIINVPIYHQIIHLLLHFDSIDPIYFLL